ncbi:uncharacterized mitochondrial protein AtMg00810-like [Mercurialis annua]|uniref:uncharacterized mitochondrial protein AtMg00810-like n=1 Tax=Mercurialis annua TaxID=3986 RepID=UPI0024AE8D2B|nr:uncharacterized mitochondrial protein AtMg00810-like [Mercurialis annua]
MSIGASASHEIHYSAYTITCCFWKIRQLDVSNAFLHGHLDEEVFMAQPQDSQTDTSLLYHQKGPITSFCLLYVDEIVLTGLHPSLLQSIIDSLQSKFALKDIGSLHYFLGIEAQCNSSGLLLTQCKYIRDLLSKKKLEDMNGLSTPACPLVKLSATIGSPMHDHSLYRSIVGGLLSLSLSRPGISFAVNKVADFMHSPVDIHWLAIKRILRYFKNTFQHGLLIHPFSSLHISVYSDADWATSLMIENLLLELHWLRSLLKELHKLPSTTLALCCDNVSAIYLTTTPIFNSSSKHIEIDGFQRSIILSRYFSLQTTLFFIYLMRWNIIVT